MQVATFMCSFTKDILPDVFKEYFIYNSDINAYETRNANKLYILFIEIIFQEHK